MMNAYRLGQLTAQPQKFEKMAENSHLRKAVMQKFAAVGSDLDVAPKPEPAFTVSPEAPPISPSEIKGITNPSPAKGILNKLQAGSESVGKTLGGEAGKGFLKNPHTRTIAALLALLTAGGVGGAMMSGGDSKKE